MGQVYTLFYGLMKDESQFFSVSSHVTEGI